MSSVIAIKMPHSMTFQITMSLGDVKIDQGLMPSLVSISVNIFI